MPPFDTSGASLPLLRPRPALRWGLAGCLLAACATSPPSPLPPVGADAGAERPIPEAPTLRLPTTVRPVREALALTLLPAASTFSGTATLSLNFESEAQHFWLHAEGLTLDEARLTAGARQLPVQVTPVGGELWLVQLTAPFGPGEATLVLRYTGPIDAERSRGIYRVNEGTTPYLYTFFEALDARRAFPCFDEPSFKIPWALSLTIPASDVAFANTASVSVTDAGQGLQTVTFAQTRPLPSYLVAFVVGPFEVVKGEPAGNEGVPLQFLVPQGRAAELHYAREFLPKAVKALEDLTGVPYPYGKLDVAVVPRYWGTMEHPGLVAIGQPILLMSVGQESPRRRQFAVNISTHELAHYWFGDLVTAAWWDDIWLHEALGTWLDLKATDAVDSSFRFARLALSRRATALAADALPTARAIRQPVLAATDIEASFDAALTYDKGSIVLGMFEQWVSPRAWKRGLKLYLERNADKNATAEEFFRAMDEGTGRPVGDALSTFLVQPGAPLLSLALRCNTGELPVLELQQERFLAERAATPPTATWQLPVCVRASWGRQVERACVLLSDPQAELTLPVGGCPTSVVANEGGLGYYRVAYAAPLRHALLEHPDQLEPVELASFASDIGALAQRGDVPAEEALALGATLVKQRDSDVVLAGLDLLALPRRGSLSAELRAAQSARLETLLGKRARALGWKERPTDTADERRLRPLVVPLVAVKGKDASLSTEARPLADAWLRNPSDVEEDLVGAVLSVAAASGDEALFAGLEQASHTLPRRESRQQAIVALGGFHNAALAAQARELLLREENDLRDWTALLEAQLSTDETQDEAYAFVDSHFEALKARMRDDEVVQLLGSFGVFCDARMRSQVEASFAARAAQVDGGEFRLSQALQAIEQCTRAQSRLRAGVTAWLAPASRPR